MSFERHTRRKLKNYHSEVDTDALWSSIQNDIPNEKEKKKRGIFFLFFGFAVIGGIVALYNNPTVKSQLANYIAPIQPQTNKATLLPEDTFYENQMPLFADASVNDFFVSEQNTPQIAKTKAIHTNQRIKNEVLNYQYLADQNSVTNSHINIISLEDKPKSIIEKTSNLSIDKTTIYPNPIPTLFGLVEQLQEEEIIVALLDEELEETIEESEKEESNKKVGIAIGVSSSYAISNAQIKAKSSSHNFYARKRNLSENAVSTYSLSGNVVFSFKKNIQFRTGLSYTKISEKYTSRRFSYAEASNKDLITDPDSGDADVITNSGLEVSQSYQNNGNNSQAPTSRVEVSKFTSTNKHQFLDIPLVLGYEFKNKRISFLIETGAYINLVTNSSGYTVTPYGSYTKIKEQNNRFKKNIILTTYTGLSTTFDISDVTFLKVGVQHQYTPFSITSKESLLQQKYHSAGIHIGIFHTLE